jgi:hypothetical protein
LCFYEDFRYSADLDFSIAGLNVSEALALLRQALDRCANSVEVPRLDVPDADPLLIHYVGPLGGERHLKLDLADNELIVGTTERPVIIRYPDQPSGPT